MIASPNDRAIGRRPELPDDRSDQLDLQHFGRLLLEQRRFRLDQLRELAEGSQQPSPGPMSPYAEVTATLAQAARAALADVEAALQRLRTGRFGRCTLCQCQLPREQLELVPSVAYCQPCLQARARASERPVQLGVDAAARRRPDDLQSAATAGRIYSS